MLLICFDFVFMLFISPRSSVRVQSFFSLAGDGVSITLDGNV